MPSASYLQPLVAPLRFLAQSDFARLSTVKGLEGLVRKALEGARAARSGADVQLLERVARALEQGGPDSPQEALRALAPRVREAAGPTEGIGRPVSKERRAREPASARDSVGATLPRAPDPARTQASSAGPLAAPTGTRASTGPTAPSTPRAPTPDVPSPPSASPRRRKPRAQGTLLDEPRKPGRKARTSARAAPETPEGEVARPMSAAPRRGPLAQPIGGSGIRVPPRLVEGLNRKGLQRVGDLLFLLPRAYEDRRRLSTLRELRPGERGVAVGTVRM